MKPVVISNLSVRSVNRVRAEGNTGGKRERDCCKEGSCVRETDG